MPKIHLSAIRAKQMKLGKTLPIHTECEWEENRKERNKPLDLNVLWDRYDPSVKLNRHASWPYQDYDEWNKL